MEKLKINPNYFTKPKSKLINNLTLSKYSFYKIDIYDEKPCIYISPNVSIIGKNLITKCLNIKFVFLKEDIVSKINSNKLSEKEENLLLEEIKSLTNFGYSISLFWNDTPSLFGENEKITKYLALFLHKTKLDVKFLSFPGEFFALPVWSQNYRKTKIYANQKIIIRARNLEGLNKKEIEKTFHDLTPSSANEYRKKFPVNIQSNNTAVGLEQVIYACPNCKKLLSLYSEYSCIKCKECGSAIEFGKNGNILFSKNISSFDDIADFQFSCLNKHDFNIYEIIQYNKITQILSENCKKTINIDIILHIYAEKLVIENPLTHKKTNYYYEDFESVNYFQNNLLSITTKNAKRLNFFGKNNENLLIIKDLVKINKN